MCGNVSVHFLATLSPACHRACPRAHEGSLYPTRVRKTPLTTKASVLGDARSVKQRARVRKIVAARAQPVWCSLALTTACLTAYTDPLAVALQPTYAHLHQLARSIDPWYTGPTHQKEASRPQPEA